MLLSPDGNFTLFPSYTMDYLTIEDKRTLSYRSDFLKHWLHKRIIEQLTDNTFLERSRSKQIMCGTHSISERCLIAAIEMRLNSLSGGTNTAK